MLLSSVQAQTPATSALYRYVSEKRATLKTTSTIILFKEGASPAAALKITLSTHTNLVLLKNKSLQLFADRPQSVLIIIPSGNTTHKLELVQEDIAPGKLPVDRQASAGVLPVADSIDAVHYRGYIAGDPQSIASLSIFENGEVMCLFSGAAGNYNLGKTSGNNYVLYNSGDLKAQLSFECGTDKLPAIKSSLSKSIEAIPVPDAAPDALCKKVRIYWEGSYKLYSNNFNSNFSNTVNYLSGLFNQVAVMYQNEGIIIELSKLMVWTSADPYTTNNSGNGLNTLQSRWNGLGNNFTGDLCVLVDGGPTNNGGVAYLLDNDLCNRAYAYGYADIYASYNTVPVYSWDVEALTHEMGHMMGSHHTHWCGWKTAGTCGAIDNCSAVEASDSCRTCSATTNTNPSAPAGFMGTVMSYCYLRSGIGINLSYGFGPLPQAAMRLSISNAVCPSLDNTWTGAAGTAWENAANWRCGSLPTINTDVTIPAGLSNYPVIKSSAICRRLIQKQNTKVTVSPGFTLKIAGSNQ